MILASTVETGLSVSGTCEALIRVTTAQRFTVSAASPVSGPASAGESWKKLPFRSTARASCSVEPSKGSDRAA